MRSLAAPLAATVAVAALVRALYAAGLAAHPELVQPVLDGAANLGWAKGLLAGTWPGGEPFFRPPGYLVALAGIVGAAGADPAAIVRWQLALGIATPALACALAARLGGTAAAWVAGLGAALYPTFLFLDGQLLSSFLAVPTFLGAMLLGDVVRAGGGRRATVASGLLLGAAATAWPLVLPAGLWLVAGLARRGRRVDATLAAAAVLAAPLAATAHNVRASDPAFVATQGGLNLWLGNGPDANGMSATFPEAPTALGYGMVRAAAAAAEAREGRRLSPSEVSAHYVRRTASAIAADPARWIGLLGKKAFLALSAREIPNNHDFALFQAELPPLRGPGWGVWLPLAVVGAWRGRRRAGFRWAAGGTLIVLAGCVAFFVNDRFRVPAAPLVVALGAAGAVGIVRDLRARRTAAVAASILAVVAAGAFVRWNPFHVPAAPWPMAYVLVGEAERDRGELVRSLRWIDRALAEEPKLYPARLARIELLRRTGRIAEAREEVDRALASFPDEPALLHERAVLLDLSGDPAAALAEVDRAIARDPSLEAARISRAVMLVRLDRREEAVAALRAFLAARPTAAEAARARGLLDAIERGGPGRGSGPATPDAVD